MLKRLLLAGSVAMLVLTGAAGLGAAQDELRYVRGAPDLDVYVPDPTLRADSTSELTIQIANDGEVDSGAVSNREIVTTARSVTVELEDDDVPFTVETRKQSIGSVSDGGFEEVPITVTVPKNVEPGEYSLDVELRYSHTFQFLPKSSVTQERSRRTTESIDPVYLLLTHALSIPYLLVCAGIGTVFSVMVSRAAIAERGAIGVVFVLFLVESVVGGADEYDWIQYFSPTHYYEPTPILIDGTYELIDSGILLVAFFGLLLLSQLLFHRRDI
jgi:hypothetical protein